MLYMLIGIASVTLIGFIAHRIGLCLVRGVRLALDRQPGLLVAILMSGLWVGAYSVLANLNNWPQPFMRFAFSPLFALGGFIFGIGASVNQGCSVSTMHKFARGNLSMLFTMAGWFFGWCLWIAFSMGDFINTDHPVLPMLESGVANSMLALSVLFTIIMVVLLPKERERWLGVSMIGLLVATLIYIEPHWAPSRFIQDSGAALLEGKPLPSLYRATLVFMLLVGMWLSVLMLRDIKLIIPGIHKILRHSIAGLLMGFGGAMALGGNDSQILIGLPAVSVGAISAVTFMLIGIAVEQFLYARGSLFYQKR